MQIEKENKKSKKNGKNKKRGLWIGALLLVCSHSWANSNEMQSTLVRIEGLLSRIQRLVTVAAQHKNRHSRVKFCFSCLRHDLKKVEQGITQGLHQVILEPHPVVPLSGDYLQEKAQ